MSRIIKCDRCGAEIKGDKAGYIALNWRDLRSDELMDGNPFEKMDYCGSCMGEIEEFIKPHPVTRAMELADAIIPDNFKDDIAFLNQEEPDPVEEAEKEEAKPAVKKPRILQLDMGKVMALRNAGWTYEKIADEFGCATQTVLNHIKREQQRYGGE